jgi:hypothetical protein
MTPFDSPLTEMQASQVRDIVEILLAEFLEEYDWGFFASIQIASVSLTAVEHVDYSFNSKQVEVSFGGVVYFQGASVDNVPSQDALTKLIVEGLHQDGLLLPALQAEFPLLSRTTLDALRRDPTKAPITTMAPTVAVADSIDKVQRSINGGGDGGGQNVGAVAGSVVSGFGIFVLGILFRLSTKASNARIGVKRTKGHDVGGKLVIFVESIMMTTTTTSVVGSWE